MEFRAKSTGLVGIDQFDGLLLGGFVKELPVRPESTYINQYEYSCTLGVLFCSNGADYARALRGAKKKVARALNSDTLLELDHIRMAIHSGQRHEALDRCDKLEARLAGEYIR